MQINLTSNSQVHVIDLTSHLNGSNQAQVNEINETQVTRLKESNLDDSYDLQLRAVSVSENSVCK